MKYRERIPVNVVLFIFVLLCTSSCSTSSASQEFEVRLGTVDVVVAAKGKVEPMSEVQVTSKMIGRIKTVLVNEGDSVRTGQLIAQMEDDELLAQLAQAESHLEEARARLAEVEAGPREQELETARARLQESEAVLAEARSVLERYQALLEDRVISRAEFDEARRRYEVAGAQYRSAEEYLSLVRAGAREEVREVVRAQVRKATADVAYVHTMLENTRITAPASGMVLWRFMEPGEVIVLQRPQPILTIADLSRVRVRAEIDESEIGKIRVGQEATVRSDAYPKEEFRGKVVELAGSVGPKSIRSERPSEMLDVKVLDAIIELPANVALKLGLTVDVEITLLRKEDVPIVPRTAVEERNGEAFVFVRSEGSSSPQKIVKGVQDDRYVEVREGIKVGDVVLVSR